MNIDPNIYDQTNTVQKEIGNKLIEMIKEDEIKRYFHHIYLHSIFSSVILILQWISGAVLEI